MPARLYQGSLTQVSPRPSRHGSWLPSPPRPLAPEPRQADLALALAAEFRPPLPGASAAVDDLATGLLGAALETPGAQLCALRRSGRRATALPDGLRWAGIDDRLLDRVAVHGCGHPLALAVACVEVARRAGIELGVVAGGAGCVVAHLGPGEPLRGRGGRLVECAAAPATPAGSARTRSRRAC